MTNVLFSVHNQGIATITLNRPKAINSLTYDMLSPIHNKLKEWEQDPSVSVIILKGEGPKGFCAGGDIKTLYQAKENPEAFNKAMEFFKKEYDTDAFIANFSKPIIAYLDGIVMGGGVGLSYGASHRIVTEKTKWAMPEMNIGFFPDVGAAYFLNQAPGYTGRYLALTSSIITASDVLYAKAADVYMKSSQFEPFQAELKSINWTEESNIHQKLDELLKKYTSEHDDNGILQVNQALIDKHFSHETVEQIIESLASDPSKFAQKTKETILEKSPVSLKVTLAQLIKGKNKSFKACLDTDFIIARNFLKSDDFYEGVRSVVIDKDKQPVYKYQQLADVPDSLIKSFFIL
ncbi:MAG: enoyl-CoA hydratase/isomerase family protein [Virgibacillus proomii]|jgi:enoyl-CoA hydratase/carnithine racemase